MIDLAAVRRAIDPAAPPKGNIKCPVHDDRNPSLSVSVGEDGRLLCRCYAGCDQDEVYDEVKRRAGHLLNGAARDFQRSRSKPRETVYLYTDADGQPLARVTRIDRADGDKTFRQSTPDGRGGWRDKGPKAPKPLYRLPALAASPAAPVVICEGEKACEAAQRLLDDGYVCTSYMGGAGSVEKADLTPLQGRDVIVWPDADDEGTKAAGKIVKRLASIAARVRVVRVADLPAKADAADVQWTPADFAARLIEPGSGGPALELPRLLDLRALPIVPPPPAFIVPDWLPAGEVALFAGHGGTGKSAIALYLACCVALGRPFFGLPTVRRRVLLLAAEDTQAVTHWRLARLAVHMGFEVADLADWLTIADATGADAELLTETRDSAALTHVYEWVRQRMADHEVLILDGASDTFGASEINRRHVRQFVRAVRRLVPATGAAVIVAHVDKATARNADTSQGYSGSTAWSNSVRARWYLRPDDAGGGLLLELQKSNLAAAGASIAVRWNPEYHVFVGEATTPPGRHERHTREGDERAAVLALIRDAEAAGDPLPTATRGERSAHAVAEARGLPEPLRGKRGRARFYAAVEALRAAGAVRVRTVKTACRHFREVYLGAAEATERADATEHFAEATERFAEATER